MTTQFDPFLQGRGAQGQLVEFVGPGVVQGSVQNQSMTSKITSRKRRVLCLGDSMFGGLLPSMITNLDANTEAITNGWGGENTANTAAVLSPSQTYLARAGNTLLDNRLSGWTKSRCTVTRALEPSTGKYMWHCVDTDPNLYGLIQGTWDVTADQANGCFISFKCIQPTVAGAQISFSGYVGAVRKFLANFSPSSYTTSLEGRFGFSLPAGWAAPGDHIDLTLLWDGAVPYTPGNDLWITDLKVNLGSTPSGFSENTSGVAQTSQALAQIFTADAVDRSRFDLVVICHANDTGFGSSRSRQALSATIDTALAFAPRVLLLNPPPTNSAGTFVYNDSPFNWRQTIQDESLAHNCFWDDSWARVSALVTQGYTATQLMQDAIHPSTLGTQLIYAQAIVDCLNSLTDKIPIKLGPGADCRIGSLVQTGVWTDEVYVPSQVDQTWLTKGIDFSGAWAQKSAGAVGETITYKVTGRQIALLFVYGTTVGTVTVTVDGNPLDTPAIDLSGAIFNYPRTYRLRDANDIPYDFGDGEHTVVVTVASGTVRMIGCMAY
jgi:hypothetical protein